MSDGPKPDKFVKNAQKTINSMQATFKRLESLGNMTQTLCEGRREFEEENALCGCVSEAFEDMAQMTDVVCHVLQTYATMLKNAAEKALQHDEAMERAAEAQAQAQRILGGLLNRGMGQKQTEETDVSKLN